LYNSAIHIAEFADHIGSEVRGKSYEGIQVRYSFAVLFFLLFDELYHLVIFKNVYRVTNS